ncbi:MAG: NADH-quinone oxidoreductase subunit C [Acidobacteria bacterium]|nr:MAG: NADH-quinone oxidoreductase subunit C [Acidobacteriota bacterium]
MGDSKIVAEASRQNANVVAECLRSWNPKAVAEVIEFRGETTIVVPRELLRATAERCREDAKLQYNLLSDATCLDRYPAEPRFELSYHLVSIPKREKVRLRVRLGGNDAVVDSLVPVWPGANWLEREIFDLFGIRFTGHPDLRRILLPDDWEGYPLRRDYPVEGYRDVPNTGEMFRKSSTP